MKPRLITFLLLLLLSLAGCDSPQEEPNAPEARLPKLKPAKLLATPIKIALVETATEALPFWRETAAVAPALVLFSNDPFLEAIPERLKEQALNLVKNGTTEQIKARAVDITPNPLLLHSMAVDAALRAGMFSELIWVLPSKTGEALPPLDEFSNKLIKANLINQEEAKSLRVHGNKLRGNFRGIPVTITNMAALPIPSTDAWIHFDLSFFKPLYKNEVSSPLYPLILDVMRAIRKAELNSLGASISHSNLGGALSLKIRFIGQDIAHLISHPNSIDAPLPDLQFRRSQNLYLEQFMKTAEILENSIKMEELAPNDASVKYELYNVHRTLKRGVAAQEYLDQAVALDNIYAIEYLNLADTAVAKNKPDAAIEMLAKARSSFPDNPLITLMEAEIQLKFENKVSAMALIRQLKALPWSEVYDNEMPRRLDRLEKTAQSLATGNVQ